MRIRIQRRHLAMCVYIIDCRIELRHKLVQTNLELGESVRHEELVMSRSRERVCVHVRAACR